MSSHVCKHQEIIPQALRETLSMRYHVVTRAINREFWGIDSELEHSLYVGSYGRGTAVNTSDLDILAELPQNRYMQYDVVKGNGQSRLLQAVRLAILNIYPRSDVRADGQVVIISFSDGMKFEILPAFKNTFILQSFRYNVLDMSSYKVCSLHKHSYPVAIVFVFDQH